MATKEARLVYGFVRRLHEINLLPKDILSLIAQIFGRYGDKINKSLSDDIYIKSSKSKDFSYQMITRINDYGDNPKSYLTAVGDGIIIKGQKQVWKMKLVSTDNTLVVGIVDSETIFLRDVIGQFYDKKLGGYGISTYTGAKYHNYEYPYTEGTEKFPYAQQFKLGLGDTIILTLDLSQEESDKGLLRYEVEKASNKSKQNKNKQTDEDNIKMDDKYTNIAFEVDINGSYRLAISMYKSKPKIALLCGESI